jgi:spore maturation protein CgeB
MSGAMLRLADGAPAGAAADLRAPTAVRQSRPSVLVIGSHCFLDSMEWHVVETLRALGCAAEFFEARAFGGIQNRLQKALLKSANLLLREPERLVERRLFAALERTAPQLILVILGSQLSPKTVQLLRARTAAPIVCWCQDQMTTLGRQYLLGAGYDAVYVKDRYLQDLFSRMSRATPFHYLPEACNPRVHRSLDATGAELAQLRCDVMIAGSLYYFRQEILAALAEFDLRIYGHSPEWLVEKLPERHMRRNLFGDDKVHAARAARVALNPLHYAEVDALNCRTFELAGCGAFQIVTDKPVLAEHFERGREIETFASLDELVEKTRYYVRNPEQALAIAAAGQRRAHREHSYEARLGIILDASLR